MVRYFEDFAVGDRWELGRRTLSREEIVAFAREWDPQGFHTGERTWAFGKDVIASGVQTIGVWMRMFVDAVLNDTAVVAGKEVHNMKMLLPVLPGMELVGFAEVLSVEESRRAERGVIGLRGELRTAGGELVWEQTSDTVVARRPTTVVASAGPDPVRLALRTPEDPGVEDALLELDGDGPVVVESVVLGDDGMLHVVAEATVGADEALAVLRRVAPAIAPRDLG